MNTISSCVFFLCACVCGPAILSGQESLPEKTIRGNSGIVYSIAFSPDGKSIASGGVDKVPKLWNLEDGLVAETFPGHTNFVNSVAFSPDGKSLASAGDDGTIRIFRIGAGSGPNTVKGDRDSVWSAVFFPDGERLASGGNDGTVKLWRVGSRKPYKTLKGHSGYVYSVSISSDGKHVASGSADHNIKIWDAESGARKLTLAGHTNVVNSVAFSPSGEHLASGSDDGAVRLWRVKDGECVKTFQARRDPVLSVLYSPDGASIFAGGADRQVTVWSVTGGDRLRTYKGHAGSVKSVALSPDGNYLASGSFDKTIKIWLTPLLAKLQDERNREYELHYKTGLQLLSSANIVKLKKAALEFQKALSYKRTNDCEDKLAEAQAAVRRQELLLKQVAIPGLKLLLAFAVLFVIGRMISKAGQKKRARKALPGRIKIETLSGNYENAFNLYNEYKAIGGKAQDLPQNELLELYKKLRTLEELPRENLPYHFFLSYAAGFASEGNYGMAIIMLRSGKLADALKKPEEFDAFVDIYEKARRPERLLELKLSAFAYSGLAEAFLKVKNYSDCEKMCGFKKQFYAKELSPRDNELLAASRARPEQF